MAPILVITSVYSSYFPLKLDLVNNVCGGGNGASKMGLKWGVITDDPVEKIQSDFVYFVIVFSIGLANLYYQNTTASPAKNWGNHGKSPKLSKSV